MAMVAEVTESITSAPVCVVADAYFSKATFFNALIEKHISLVTRLRWDAVGFDAPVYCGRGRPPKRGKKWKLATLIDCLPSKQLTVRLYGKPKTCTVVVRDLYLRAVNCKVRLVVINAKKRPIL